VNWFKIEVNKGKEGAYHYVGASELNVEELLKRAQHGYFIKLDNLLYTDRGDMKEWAEWDPSLIPTAYINPKDVLSIMQFKGDPREKYHE